MLKNAKPPKKNITKDEFSTLKELKDMKYTMILKEYKGNSTVIMKTEDHHEIMREHLNSGCYRKISKDSMKKVVKDVTMEIKKSSLNEELN